MRGPEGQPAPVGAASRNKGRSRLSGKRPCLGSSADKVPACLWSRDRGDVMKTGLLRVKIQRSSKTSGCEAENTERAVHDAHIKTPGS